MTNFITIRTAAKQGILPEHRLRQMVHTGECPGFYSGNRFLINVDQLMELLDRKSREPKTREVVS